MSYCPENTLSQWGIWIIETTDHARQIPNFDVALHEMPIKEYTWFIGDFETSHVHDNLESFVCAMWRSRPYETKKQIVVFDRNKKYMSAIYDLLSIERNIESNMTNRWAEFREKKNETNDFGKVVQVKYNTRDEIISVLIDMNDWDTYMSIPITSRENISKKDEERYDLESHFQKTQLCYQQNMQECIRLWRECSDDQKKKYLKKTIEHRGGWEWFWFGTTILSHFVWSDGSLWLLVKKNTNGPRYDIWNEDEHDSQHANHIVVVQWEKIYKTNQLHYKKSKKDLDPKEKIKTITSIKYNNEEDVYDITVDTFAWTEVMLKTWWWDGIQFDSDVLRKVFDSRIEKKEARLKKKKESEAYKESLTIHIPHEAKNNNIEYDLDKSVLINAWFEQWKFVCCIKNWLFYLVADDRYGEFTSYTHHNIAKKRLGEDCRIIWGWYMKITSDKFKNIDFRGSSMDYWSVPNSYHRLLLWLLSHRFPKYKINGEQYAVHIAPT